MTPFEQRFWSKVDASADCWEWTGGLNTQGYGIAHRPRKRIVAHRVAWELLVGPIPDRHVVDHLCRNKRCVNPAHLEPVDNRTNLRRGFRTKAARARKARVREMYAVIVKSRPKGPPQRKSKSPEQQAHNRTRMYAYYRTPKGRAQRAASNSRVRFGEDVPWQTFMLLMEQACVGCGLSPAGGVDHIVPGARGGRNVESNLQPMCLPCNRRKNWRAAS